MHIDAVELFHIALPLRAGVPGNTDATLETVLVRLESGKQVGWGEASPGNAPRRSSEWAGGVFHTLKTWLAPAVVGNHFHSGSVLQERLAPFCGNQFAKAALDTAWWDLSSRLDDKPLYEAIGAKRNAVPLGVGFDREESSEQFSRRIKKAIDDGYSRIELKFRPGWEVEMLRFVRSIAEMHPFHIDCEAALRLEYLEIFQRVDDFFLTMIEQPLAADDLVGHAMLAESIRTPLCLDESITTLEQAEMAAELKSCQTINLKLGRVGGFTPALAISEHCKESELSCYVGADLQSAIGQRASLALAARDEFTYPTDYFAGEERFEVDLASPLSTELVENRRCARLWSEPGLGVVPDAEVLERHTLEHVRLA